MQGKNIAAQSLFKALSKLCNMLNDVYKYIYF